MPEIAIGLPNQALMPLVSSFVPDAKVTVPHEKSGVVDTLAAGTETDVIAEYTVASNKKVSLDSFKVKASNIDTIFRLYRNGSVVLVFQGDVADKTFEVFENGIGKEFDEGESIKVTAESAAGGGNAWATLSGSESLKRDQLFSQVLA